MRTPSAGRPTYLRGPVHFFSPVKEPILSSDLAPLQLFVPDHVADIRRDAAVILASTPQPVEAEESWRYSGIDRFSVERFASDGEPDSVVSLSVDLPAEAQAAGVRVIADQDQRAAVSYFDALGRSRLAHAVRIEVPSGIELSAPIRIRTTLVGSGIVGTSVRIVLGANSGATVIEEFRSDEAAVRTPSLLVSDTLCDLGDGARLHHASVQMLGPADWVVGSIDATTGRDATMSSVAVALGGDYARLETRARAIARGAHSELLAVYFAAEHQVHDFRTRQEHIAPHTTSNLLFKGAVEDQARSVYSGLIHIGKDARGTVAHQTNRNLLLSPDASAESVPNLEIENNDVKCSHASAIGPIDDDHRYYLESRGVPPSEADRLIVLGFFADLLDRVPDESLRAELIAAVGEKFDRRATAEREATR